MLLKGAAVSTAPLSTAVGFPAGVVWRLAPAIIVKLTLVAGERVGVTATVLVASGDGDWTGVASAVAVFVGSAVDEGVAVGRGVSVGAGLSAAWTK